MESDVLSAKIANGEAYQKVTFRPRILRKVANADASTTILGQKSKIPVFISPACVRTVHTATVRLTLAGPWLSSATPTAKST